MPCSRQSSGTGTLPSACFNIVIIWVSLNHDFFIGISSVIIVRKFYLSTQWFFGGLPEDDCREQINYNIGDDLEYCRIGCDVISSKIDQAFILSLSSGSGACCLAVVWHRAVGDGIDWMAPQA